MPTAIRSYVRALGLDAYVVGGAVRDELLGIPHSDEDFLVPGVDHAGLHAALEPHGRVEDMEVHGQLVGVRFYPDDPAVRGLVPSGIELTPPRIERSTGPGHHDFEIVADGSASVEDDMRATGLHRERDCAAPRDRRARGSVRRSRATWRQARCSAR